MNVVLEVCMEFLTSEKEIQLRRNAIDYIMRKKKLMKEFEDKYPPDFINKLICFKCNITEPISKQILDVIKFENKSEK